PGARPLILIAVRDSLFQSSDELANFVDYYRSIIHVYAIKPWNRDARRAHAWLHFEHRLPRDGERDTQRIQAFLSAADNNHALQRLASTPFYADLLLETVGDATSAPPDDVSLVDDAINGMCRREYAKGAISDEILPIE